MKNLTRSGSGVRCLGLLCFWFWSVGPPLVPLPNHSVGFINLSKIFGGIPPSEFAPPSIVQEEKRNDDVALRRRDTRFVASGSILLSGVPVILPSSQGRGDRGGIESVSPAPLGIENRSDDRRDSRNQAANNDAEGSIVHGVIIGAVIGTLGVIAVGKMS